MTTNATAQRTAGTSVPLSGSNHRPAPKTLEGQALPPHGYTYTSTSQDRITPHRNELSPSSPMEWHTNNLQRRPCLGFKLKVFPKDIIFPKRREPSTGDLTLCWEKAPSWIVSASYSVLDGCFLVSLHHGRSIWQCDPMQADNTNYIHASPGCSLPTGNKEGITRGFKKRPLFSIL